MKIGVVGAGYVGLVAGICLAEMGNVVMIAEKDPEKVALLNDGHAPHYEPGLDELRIRSQMNRRLSFTISTHQVVNDCDVIFLAVGTPSAADGSVDLHDIEAVIIEIAKAMNGYRLIVVKSTVPPGTNRRLENLVSLNTFHPFDLVSNPEFLKEGTAVNDFLHPDRVIVGARTERAKNLMRQVYTPFFRTGYRLMETDPESAEMIKYASNVMLAARISLMNEISRVCQAMGADAEHVRIGVGLDRRIGPTFLFPGLGYGGSCFPKDVRAMIHIAESAGVSATICRSVDQVNRMQREFFLPYVRENFGDDLTGRIFAFLGLAYKPKTDDIRESPALCLAEVLLRRGATIRGFDPQAGDNAAKANADIKVAGSVCEAVRGADAVFLCTEWNEFRGLDWMKLAPSMKSPVIFDGRNIYDPEEMREVGVTYYSVGRVSVIPRNDD